MSTSNRLDIVWANLSAGDRIVLLGHDRPFLDDTDRTTLSAVIAAKTEPTKQSRPARGRGSRPTRRTPLSA
jgi:hypothetical protein